MTCVGKSDNIGRQKKRKKKKKNFKRRELWNSFVRSLIANLWTKKKKKSSSNVFSRRSAYIYRVTTRYGRKRVAGLFMERLRSGASYLAETIEKQDAANQTATRAYKQRHVKSYRRWSNREACWTWDLIVFSFAPRVWFLVIALSWNSNLEFDIEPVSDLYRIQQNSFPGYVSTANIVITVEYTHLGIWCPVLGN